MIMTKIRAIREKCTFILVAYMSILSILLVNKKQLIIYLISLKLYIIPYKTKLLHSFIINNRDIKIINKI